MNTGFRNSWTPKVSASSLPDVETKTGGRAYPLDTPEIRSTVVVAVAGCGLSGGADCVERRGTPVSGSWSIPPTRSSETGLTLAGVGLAVAFGVSASAATTHSARVTHLETSS